MTKKNQIDLPNLPYIEYTCKHRLALKFVIEKLVKDSSMKDVLLHRAEYHDIDKVLLYLITSKKIASTIHRGWSAHHMENDEMKCIIDIFEAVMDYESAGYTKEDKPLNAYDTVKTYNKGHYEELMKVMNYLGIDNSYSNTSEDKDWVSYCESHEVETIQDILKKVLEWVIIYPDVARSFLRKVENMSEEE